MTKYTKEDVDDLRRMVLDDYLSQRGLTEEMVSPSVVEDRVRTYIAAGVNPRVDMAWCESQIAMDKSRP